MQACVSSPAVTAGQHAGADVLAGANASDVRSVYADRGWVLMQAALRFAGPLRGDPKQAALPRRGRSDRGRPAPVPDAHPL